MDVDLCQDILQELQKFRRHKILCDVTIVIEHDKFSLHKVVLAASSEYFRILFTGNMKEKTQAEISIKGITTKAFEICTKFLYHEVFDIKLEDVGDLLHAACFFQIPKLKDRCTRIIKSNIDIENCVHLYQISQVYGCREIQVESKNMILQNAEKLFQDDVLICDLNEDTLAMMMKSEDLCVSDESLIFEALLKWDGSNKTKNYTFCEVVRNIRLPLMDKNYFTNFVWKNKHMQECEKCKIYLTETMLYFLDGKTRNLKRHQLSKRIPPVYVVVGSQCEMSVKNIKFNFDDTFIDYITSEQIPSYIDQHSVCIYNGNICVFDSAKTKRWFRFDRGEWPVVSEKTCKDNFIKSDFSVICFRNCFLVVGGRDMKTARSKSSIDCFNILKNKWTEFSSLKSSRCSPTLVVYRGCLYAIGGWDYGYLLSTEKYDHKENTWLMMPSMKEARRGHAATVHRDKIFVAGGWDGWRTLTSVETFQDGDNSWTSIRNLKVGRREFGMFVHNKKLYAFGGERDEVFSLYEVFDDEKDIWQSCKLQNCDVRGCKVLAA